MNDELEKEGESDGGGEAPASTPTTETSYISYEDFAKIQIKIGTIISADIVEDADKLFIFKVDFGNETRQILSGIREFFSGPEELVGKQCPFVVNLKPRMIRGFESQGMILAASNENTFGLLTPHQPLPSGSTVL